MIPTGLRSWRVAVVRLDAGRISARVPARQVGDCVQVQQQALACPLIGGGVRTKGLFSACVARDSGPYERVPSTRSGPNGAYPHRARVLLVGLLEGSWGTGVF